MTSTEDLLRLASQTLLEHYAEYCEGAVIVDAEARVVWMNDSYPARLGISLPAKVVGQPIESIIPNSLMRQVVESGRPIMLDIMEYRDDVFVVTRLPLRNPAGEIVGAVGFMLFDDPRSLTPLVSRFRRLSADLAEAERRLAAERRTRYTFTSFIGTGAACTALKQAAKRAARTAAPVLILGETGTGKELLAQAIHAASPRADAPFIAVNIAAIPETLLEAEFFGVAPGAFTGAEKRGRDGKFKLADGGTLFLDEIGDMSLTLQAKLLRTLQEKEFEAVGSNRLERVDVRIIAATSRDLEAMVAGGQFRADLYYRLNVISLRTPPLRERGEDLPLLVDGLVESICREQGVPVREVGVGVVERLRQHRWPGNVRELSNLLARALLMSDGDSLEVADLACVMPHPEAAGGASAEVAGGMLAVVEQAEREAISAALRSSKGNKAQAARQLGISRTALYEKIATLGIATA